MVEALTDEEYKRIHKSIEHRAAVKRERDFLEGITPAIAFLEEKQRDTGEALEALRALRAKSLQEITRLGELPTNSEVKKLPRRGLGQWDKPAL
jgi:hypothetical protein